MGFVSLTDKFSRVYTRDSRSFDHDPVQQPMCLTYVIFKGSYSLKRADGPGRTGADQFFAINLYKFISDRWVSFSSSDTRKDSS